MNDLKQVRDALEGVRNCYKTHSKISSGLWDCEIKPAIAILDRMIETPAPTEKVDIHTAMKTLWDAGYKIHGQFGWVTDDRANTGRLR